MQQAYVALMERAPAGLFPKARQLYLNKYCLDGREPEGPLRLYVQQEQAEETIEACLVEQEPRRRAIYTVKPAAGVSGVDGGPGKLLELCDGGHAASARR